MLKWIPAILCISFCLPGLVPSTLAQRPVDAETARRHADRFLELLLRRPSFGTALERVCSYHLEHDSLDQLLDELRSTPPADPEATVRQLIAGMLEIQRGNGEAAVAALTTVETQRPQDPVASLAVGLAAKAAGDTTAAISALERAISRQPSKADLRSIYRNLARLHQQNGDSTRALEVWQELEAAFPQDRSIAEDVATRLQEDGQLQPALSRWERLAATTDSPERRTQYRLSVAEIQLRLGQNQDALQTLETELRSIRPGSWLDQLIRTKLESALLAAHGRDGVVEFYRRRLQTNPDDSVSRSRLADLLAEDGNVTEAVSLYERAIERQPSSLPLRVAQIRLLMAQGNITDAVAAGRELVQLDAAGTDEFELVGRLLLRDPSLEPHEREQLASETWMRIGDDGEDAARLGYTARLHRQHGLARRAASIYRDVIRLEPDNAVWREELGQTLYELGDRQEAIEEWNRIAAGSRRSTQSLARLSEILEASGESSLALDAMRQACEDQPTIADRLRLARLLRRDGRTDAAYEQLDLAAAAAESSIDQQAVTEARKQTWKQDPALYLQISRLRQRLQETPEDADHWLQLALMYQTEQRYAEALRSVEQAFALQPSSVAAWQAAAEISFQAGLLSRAADASRRLADLSPQQRIPALQQVVRLEQQLGRLDQALEAAETLVRESPGHAASVRQFADLCFRTGRDTDGLSALRRYLQRNPDDVRLSLETAEILAEQFQMDDAVTLLWQTFDRVTRHEDRLTLLESLMSLHKDSGTAEQVIDRLSASTQLAPVDRTLCIASALQMAGQTQRAGDFLESESGKYGRDVRILKLLVELAEANDNLKLAARYQRQVATLTPDTNEQVHLATLQFRTGQLSETELSWIRDARSGSDTVAALRSIDRFLDGGRIEAAELMSQRLAADRPHDWRVLYRLAMIQWRLDRQEAAVSTLRRIADLNHADDHTFDIASAATSQALAAEHDASEDTFIRSPLARRLNQIVKSLNWLQLYTGNELWAQNLEAPEDYGAARCAAIGFLWLAGDTSQRSELLATASAAAADTPNPADWCAIVLMSRWRDAEDSTQPNELAALLHKSGEVEHQLVLAGLLCDGGVFRRPADQISRRQLSDQGSWLAAAAENVALAKPDWLNDIGGWTAVVDQLRKLNQLTAVDKSIERLLSSERPAAWDSAAELAIARQNTAAIRQCVDHIITRSSADSSRRQQLAAHQSQLASLARSLSPKQDQQTILEVTDLMLQINATRYRALPAADGTNTGDAQSADNLTPLPTGPMTAELIPGPPAKLEPPAERTASRGRKTNRPALSASSGELFFHIHLDPHLAETLSYLVTDDRQPHMSTEIRSHLSAQLQDESDPAWIPVANALAYCELLQNHADAAMLILVDVARRLPQDVSLSLFLAEYLHSQHADEEALQLITQLPPQQQRDAILLTEQLALTVSAVLHDQDRARLAASRLFELQLDRDQVRFVADHLRTADLPEIAQRFESRLSTTATGGAEQLQLVMQQYFDAGNITAAVRIARQFVLQPSMTLDGTSVVVSVQLRRAAINILAASDSIKPMIRQLQQQLSGNGATFHERHLLVELLRADGQDTQADAVAVPLRESLVQDPKAGLQLARQLERQGRLESACDVCRYLLEAESDLFHRDYYRFIRLFEKNGRLEELAEIILADGLSQSAGGHWGVQQLTERLLPLNEPLGLRLFRAAWYAWPESHQALLANITDDAVWRVPEVVAYGRQRLLPAAGETVQPWDGIAEQFQVHGRGRVSGRLTRLLPATSTAPQEDPQAVAAFREQIQLALQTHSDWHAGRLYDLLLQPADAPADKQTMLITEYLDRHLTTMPPNVAWVVACQLHRMESTASAPSVIRLLEYLHAKTESGSVLLKSGSSWDASPDFLLLQLYAERGARDEAAAVMTRLELRMPLSSADKAGRADRRRELLVELADTLRPQLPDLADQMLEVGRQSEPDAAGESDNQSKIAGAGAKKVIQAVRERLLQSGS